MNGRQAHRMGTLLLSLAMAAVGLALIVQAAGAHASPLSARLVLGVLFVAAGVARCYLELRRGRGT
jgi:hypothetical protein